MRHVLIGLFEQEFIEKMDLIKRTELCRILSRGSHDGYKTYQVLERVSRSRRILCCGQPLGIMAKQIHLGRIDELIEAVMNVLKDIRTYLLVCTFVVILQPLSGLAQQSSNPSEPKLQRSPTQWDGQRDFDFHFGTWRTHVSRLVHPLAGSKQWMEYDGTSVVSKVWNGRASLFELDVSGPGDRIEGVGLRLYNPEAHQWSLNWANSSGGVINKPMIGEFKDGRGEFFDQEEFNGQMIIARNGFSDITPNSNRFEQAFSDDGAKTWETNWVMTFKRQEYSEEKTAASKTKLPPARSEPDRGQHDFDFHFGTWKTHLKRRLHPLTGSNTWVEYEGTTVVRKVWNGRANLVELTADGPAGHFEGLNLRLYNPKSHQWSLNFANINDGILTQPTIGEFKNGRGEFFDQETLNGRIILVRFVISDITPDSCRFEQAFSDDGGKTWEVSWIAIDTRVKDESNKTH
jgi:hypothetical protein